MKSFTNHLNEQIEKAELDAINKYLHSSMKDYLNSINFDYKQPNAKEEAKKLTQSKLKGWIAEYLKKNG